jgi:TrmH family RNA methyltransferase
VQVEFHIILVEPEKSLNIGSVARAMMNLGFSHLHLVAPREYDRATANVTACWAEPLLDRMHIHETFAEALEGMEEVVALSGREGKNPPHWITLPEWSAKLPDRPARKIALVFGPEDNGLRQEHLDLARWIVRIPSTAANPSFNLAQSVLLVLYEITKTLPPGELQTATTLAEAPTTNEHFQLDRLIEAVMTESGFLREGTPAPVPGTVKNLFRRLEMNRHEMGILLGLFGRINTNLKRGKERRENRKEIEASV